MANEHIGGEKMITAIGQLFGTSGYAVHFRSLVNELNKLTPCKITTTLHQGFERDINDKELEMIKREEDYEINLIVTHPIAWRTNLSAKRNFVYLVWEGNRIPDWMLKECMNPEIEKIIVPSEHTKQAIFKTMEGVYDKEIEVVGTELKEWDKIVVIPHGVDPKIFYPIELKVGDKIKVDPMNTPNPFRFLMNKGLRNMEDRGGVQYGIKAYIEEFDGKDTELHIKINPAYGIPNLNEMFPELKDRADVVFHTINYTQKQLNELYNKCDVFLSPTRAEAFNIPCLEALACGKPVITTNYGGQTDFVTNSNGWLVDYKLTEVTHELEYENCHWGTPDHDHLKSQMGLSTGHTITPEQCVESIKDLTWENTAIKINKLINERLK